MAKVTINTANVVAAAFAPQSAEGTYETTLDAIAATLGGDPNGTDDGLLLGTADEGLNGSGLSFELERKLEEKAIFAGSLTRGISDLQRVDVAQLQFVFPFTGSRRTTAGTPVDNDFRPLRGVDAILQSAGLLSSAWTGGVGHNVLFSPSALPCSALVYAWGNRWELLDCRARSLEITFAGGQVPKATVDFAVGRIKDPVATPISVAASPTLSYGAQSTVSALPAQATGFIWRGESPSVGLQELTLRIEQDIGEFGDINAASGVVNEVSDRFVEIDGLMYVEGNSTKEVYEHEQMLADDIADLALMQWQVGAAAVGAAPAKAILYAVTTPEVIRTEYVNLGTKAAIRVIARARAAAANGELTIRYL